MKRILPTLLLCIACLFVVKAHAQNPTTVTINGQTWTKCADDPANCSFSGSSQVVYGAFPPNDPTAQYDINGPFTNGVSCFIGQVDANDPAPGFNKSCYLPPSGPPAPVVTVTANPTSITSGQSSTVSWSSTNATSCSGIGSSTATSGSLSVSPTSTTTYTETCTGAGGSGSGSATVTVGNPAPTVTLTANPSTIAPGGSSTLTLTTSNATSCTGPVSGTSGTATVSPSATTTYTENCTGPGGSGSSSTTVTVSTQQCNAGSPVTVGSTGSLIVADVTTSDQTRIFPNGSTVAINYTTAPSAADTLVWTVQDALGNQVANGTFAVPSGSTRTTLSCAFGAKAGYFAATGTLRTAGGSIAALGTRPAGIATFGLLPPAGVGGLIAPTYAFPDQHRFGAQGLNDSLPHLQALGVTWVIDDHEQSQWEPSGPNTYSPTVNDHDPFYTNNNSIHRLIRLDGIPGWDSSTGLFNDSYSLPTNQSEFGGYMAKVGTSENLIHNSLYPNDRRNYYQVTWEPSLGWPQTDGAGFFQYYNLVYPNLHSTDSHAFVMGPAEPFANNNNTSSGGRITATSNFCTRIDGVATHAYYNAPVEPGNPPELQDGIGQPAEANSLDQEIRGLRSIMQGCKPNMPLWATELGVPYDHGIQSYTSTAINQNELWAQAVVGLRSHIITLGEGAQVTTFFYGPDFSGESLIGYGTFFDIASATGGFGDRNLAPKPEAMAFATLTRVLDGTITLGYLNGLPDTLKPVYGYAFQQMGTGGKVITALWLHANNQWPNGGPYAQPSTFNQCYSLKVDATGTSGTVQVIDAFGNATSLAYTNGIASVRISEQPVYVVSSNVAVAQANVTAPVGYTGQ